MHFYLRTLNKHLICNNIISSYTNMKKPSLRSTYSMTTLKFHRLFVFFVVAVVQPCNCLRAFFDIMGSVYPNGAFHAVLKVGDSDKEYFLTHDTGSSMTWIECTHAHPTHRAYHFAYDPDETKFMTKYNPFSKSMEKCQYSVEYQDGSSTEGCLVRDNFYFFDADTQSSQQQALIFGCGALKSDRGNEPATDGLLGLGKGSTGIVTQLKDHGIITENVHGHCLSRQQRGYGFIGGGGLLTLSHDTVWIRMNTAREFYVVGRGTSMQIANQIIVMLRN